MFNFLYFDSDLLMGPIRERENKLKNETSTGSKVSKRMLGDNIVNDIKLVIEKQEDNTGNFKSMKALNSLNYQIRLVYKLWLLNRQLSKTLDLLMEVTGYQIFSPGSIFNSDVSTEKSLCVCNNMFSKFH